MYGQSVSRLLFFSLFLNGGCWKVQFFFLTSSLFLISPAIPIDAAHFGAVVVVLNFKQASKHTVDVVRASLPVPGLRAEKRVHCCCNVATRGCLALLKPLRVRWLSASFSFSFFSAPVRTRLQRLLSSCFTNETHLCSRGSSIAAPAHTHTHTKATVASLAYALRGENAIHGCSSPQSVTV